MFLDWVEGEDDWYVSVMYTNVLRDRVRSYHIHHTMPRHATPHSKPDMRGACLHSPYLTGNSMA